MNKKDSGVQWFDVPVFIVDEGHNQVEVVTNDRDYLDNPQFIVDEPFFKKIQSNFEEHRVMLDYLLGQFRQGKVDPLNRAPRNADKQREQS